ncbi:MAG: cell division/cell wall cluster transcriptional repressor MraZ [Gammaproteobacteria bacterium]|nr:cell division/cell wall cluster transcriptional repressor MraZ [Gammaproteobacteria bacterium]
MSGFLGRYEKRLDDKGRLSLPVPFRRAAADGPLVLLQYQASALTLFPGTAWGKIQERLMEYRRSDRSAAAYVRRITSFAVEVTPDKVGRFLIPGWLQEAASLEGDVLVVGSLDRIEIWNPGLFDSHLEDGAPDASEFMHKIFG